VADAEKKPWRRREGESSRAYAALLAYLRQDRLRRSARRAAKAVGLHPSTGLKLSATYEWVARAAAFDAYQERAVTARVEESKRRQVVLDHENVEKALRLASVAMDRLLERLSKSKKFLVSPAALTGLLQAAANLSRVARGEAEHRFESVTADEARSMIRRTIERYAGRAQAEGKEPS
jgi:hypothetical protein